MNSSWGEALSSEGIAYLEPRPRPILVWGVTQKCPTGCGNLYLTVNVDDDGICELFAHLGKAGGCPACMLEGGMRLASVALRSGINPQQIVRHLVGIRCPIPVWHKERQVLSCLDAVGFMLSQILRGEMPKQEKGGKG